MNRPSMGPGRFGAARGLMLILIGLLIAGCSSATREGRGSEVRLTVENNLIPPTTLSVFAIPEVGSRRLVGVVRPGETTTLAFSGRTAESYRFAAETTTGREIVSNTITLAPGSSAIWDVSANIAVPAAGR